MGRKSGKQPRNKKGQWVSYRSIPDARFGAATAQRTNATKEYILLDSDEDDGKMALVSDKRPRRSATDLQNAHTTQYYDDSDNIDEANSESSDDVDEILDEVDEVFDEAEKKMCNNLVDDQRKNKKTIKEGLEWLYQEVVGASVSLRSKKGKEASKKKTNTKTRPV